MKNILIPLICFISLNSAAKDVSRTIIESIPVQTQPFTVEFVLETPRVSFDYHSELASGPNSTSVNFQPNTPSRLGVKLGRKDFKASLSLPMSIDEELAQRYGRTKSFDFRFSHSKDDWVYELQLQRYKGFYQIINDSDDLITIRPDIYYDHLGLNGLKIYSDDEYHPNPSKQLQLNVGSGGSWLWSIDIGYNKFGGDRPLAPSILFQTFSEGSNVKSFNNYTIGSSFGYGHAWDWSKCLLSLQALFGYSVESKRWVNGKTYQEIDTAILASVGFGFHYKFKESRLGLQSKTHGGTSEINKNSLSYRSTVSELVYAMDF